MGEAERLGDRGPVSQYHPIKARACRRLKFPTTELTVLHSFIVLRDCDFILYLRGPSVLSALRGAVSHIRGVERASDGELPQCSWAQAEY